MEQTAQIVELLKKADEVTLQAFLPLKWIQEHGNKFSLLTTGPERSADATGPQLAIAGAKSEIRVELADTDDILHSANPAVSNALPEWHLYSTVTGEAIRDSVVSTEAIRKAEVKKDAEEVNEDDLVQYYSSLSSEPPTKQAKIESETTAAVAVGINGSTEAVESPASKKPDGIYVSVAGRKVLLSEVTDEDKDLMTEKEYADYYEAYMSQQ